MTTRNHKIHSLQKRDDLSRQQLATIRLTAVKRVMGGEPPADVIRELGFHRSCIYEWLNTYKQHGEVGLLAKPISGRPTQHNNRKSPKPLSGKKPGKPGIPAPTNIQQWVALLYESLVDIQYPFNSFLAALNQYLESATLIFPNLRISSSPIRAIHEESTLQATITNNKLYTDSWFTNPFLKAFTQAGNIYTQDEIMTDNDWRESEFCHSVRKLTGRNQLSVLGLGFAGTQENLCGLFAFSTTGRKIFSKQERQLLQRLRPHLETGMKLAINHWLSTYTARTLAEAIDNLEIATLMLDGKGHVLESSGAARELLEQESNVGLNQQRIEFYDKDKQAKFEQAVQASIAWRQAPMGSSPIEAMRFTYSTGRELGVLVKTITPPDMTIPYSVTVLPHVVVYISDPTKPQRPAQHKLIVHLFNLSSREARLAMLLTEGNSINEAAKTMNITQSTARTYLQHIFEKVGVKRQQELIQRVMKSVAALA